MSDQGEFPAAHAAHTADTVVSAPGGASRRILVVGVAAVAVIGAAGAGFAAGTMVGGGGTQPEDVLPSSVVAFADLDLDPGADQKLNVVRLLGRFPDVEEKYGPEPDLKDLLVKQFTDGTPLADADVDAWAGDRIGAALAWDSAQKALTPVLAVQVTDEAAALQDMQAVVPDDQVTTADGYLVVTGDLSDTAGLTLNSADGTVQTQTASQIVAAGAQSSLADSQPFSAAFDHLDDGVASLYVDGQGIAEAGEQLSSLMGGADASLTADPFADAERAGQTAAVIRAEPDAVELVGWSSAAPPGGGPVSLVDGLPDSTLFAAEATGGSDSVAEQWSRLKKVASEGLSPHEFDRSVAQLEAQFGIRLPNDLQTLLGEDAVLAVDGNGVLSGVPGIGLRSVTDPAAGADLANRLAQTLAYLSGGFGLTAQGTDDGLVVATTQEYADTLAAGDGGLGDSAPFKSAVPDAATATYLAWLDFSAVSGPLALAEPDAADLIAPLNSLGLTVGPDDGGTAIRVRLVFTGRSS
ncbi:MAG: hypothetical protein ACJ74E_08785 [Actinomycetes bacterium]